MRPDMPMQLFSSTAHTGLRPAVANGDDVLLHAATAMGHAFCSDWQTLLQTNLTVGTGLVLVHVPPQ